MSRITPGPASFDEADATDGGLEPDFKPLSAEEARQWREKNPAVSPWRVLGLQALAGILLALAAGVVSGRSEVAWSVGYGALAVVVPAAFMARALSRQSASVNPGAALAGFFVWEMVKIALTVAMLFAAPRLVAQLSWLALVVGLVVTMKVSWVAMWLYPALRKPAPKNLI